MALSKLGERAAEWASRLVSLRSLTPDDGGCLELISQRLKALGFATERLDKNGVANLWAHRGQGAPLLLWLGHVDTVPADPKEQWEYPPFSGTRAHGAVHGRGAEDMKGGLAAFLATLEELEPELPPADAGGGLSLLLTSDEEGEALWGVRHAAAILAERGSLARLCLVGEPTSDQQSGDRIRVGRRGSLSGLLTLCGQKEHVAVGQSVDNPIHRAVTALAAMAAEDWGDEAMGTFPPTSFQCTCIQSDSGAFNVSPDNLRARFNLRFSPAVTAKSLQQRIEQLCRRHALDFEIEWRLSAEPFSSTPGALRSAVDKAVMKVAGLTPERSTGGGTSDGRFIAPYGVEVVELGVPYKTLHQINERVREKDLEQLAQVYLEALRCLFASQPLRF